MGIDYSQFVPGRCQNCEFAGVVAPVNDFLKKADVDLLMTDPNAEVRSLSLLVCPTCLETPCGVLSPNLAHRRLPEMEYLVK